MLLTETQKFDIYTSILDSSIEAPCAQICNEFHQGNLLDFDTVYNFGKRVDLLTIEIENVIKNNNTNVVDLIPEDITKLDPIPSEDIATENNKVTTPEPTQKPKRKKASMMY